MYYDGISEHAAAAVFAGFDPDQPAAFLATAERFLGRPLPPIEVVPV